MRHKESTQSRDGRESGSKRLTPGRKDAPRTRSGKVQDALSYLAGFTDAREHRSGRVGRAGHSVAVRRHSLSKPPFSAAMQVRKHFAPRISGSFYSPGRSRAEGISNSP